MTNRILSLAKELIAIPTITGDTKAANEIIQVAKNHLEKFESTSFLYNDSPSLLISNQKKTKKNFKIILNAHLDVQPATKNQFIPLVKDGRLYGRGAYDMKAAAAVMILLFKEIAHKINFPLALQLTTDEETDITYTENVPSNGTAYQVKQGVNAEFVIIGECNSNLRVGNQAKGRKIVIISTNGLKAHSAYPWLGKNAIWEMNKILDKIVKTYPIAERETFETTVNIVKIESHNDATTKIPDNCKAILDIRYNAKDENKIIPKLMSLIPKEAKTEVQNIRSAHFTKPNNSYITKLQKITQKIYGQDLPLRFAHGSSDVVFYSAQGIDAVEYGPNGHGAHHDNEWVDIKSLESYYKILEQFLLSLNKPSLA